MKRNYWPLFFIGVFSLAFSLIIWTIYSAIKVPVNKDETFLKPYHDLDKNYNSIIASNKNFLKKINFRILLNTKEFHLIISDIFLSQRAIGKQSKHKNILKSGKNKILIDLKDKISNKVVENLHLNLRISKPTSHSHTIDFNSKDFKFEDGKYVLEFELPLKGNWNIEAIFKAKKQMGYFYIKSNAI